MVSPAEGALMIPERLALRIKAVQEMTAVLSILISQQESASRELRRRLDRYDRELDSLMSQRRELETV